MEDIIHDDRKMSQLKSELPKAAENFRELQPSFSESDSVLNGSASYGGVYKRFAAYISGEADSIQTYVLKLFTRSIVNT